MNSNVYAVMAPTTWCGKIDGEALHGIFASEARAEAFAIVLSADLRRLYSGEYRDEGIEKAEEYKSLDAFVREYPLN